MDSRVGLCLPSGGFVDGGSGFVKLDVDLCVPGAEDVVIVAVESREELFHSCHVVRDGALHVAKVAVLPYTSCDRTRGNFAKVSLSVL